jgi:transcription elongation GreA/GreB family factor
VNKTQLRAAILQQLRLELARQASAAEVSRDEAISEESRAENKWDTHSQEAAYLAEGQARLVAEIGSSIELYETLALPALQAGDAVALGAVVTVQTGAAAGDSPRTVYFIGPRAGGLELIVEQQPVLVVTPQSPLGRQLIGKRVGDVAQTAARAGTVTQRIVAVE